MANDFVGCLPKLSSIANCAIYESDGTCKYCKTNFYYDEDDLICKNRNTSTDIIGCLYYSELMKCLVCADGFAANATGDACPGTTTTISSC